MGIFACPGMFLECKKVGVKFRLSFCSLTILVFILLSTYTNATEFFLCNFCML